MKGFWKGLVASLLATAVIAPGAMGVNLEGQNKDAVKLAKAPYWNLAVTKASNTTYKLASKDGTALSGVNYGVLGIGTSTFDVSSNVTLTQASCSSLWGSSTNRDVHLYAAYGNTYGTSVSDSSPSTNISGGTDTTFKISVDHNPIVTVTLTLTGLNSGANIATGLTTAINAALLAAGQGAAVDVAYGTLYTITSRLAGSRSSVVVTDGTSANVADNLKIGVANAGVETSGVKGPVVCVSDVGNQTTNGSVAAGAAGYMSCTSTLASGTAVREIAIADLNCSGPVIGTVKQYAVSPDGYGVLPVKKYGAASSTVTGSGTVIFTVPGLVSGDVCNVTATALGTGPAYIKKAVVTADTITATVDANQSAGTSTINYLCW